MDKVCSRCGLTKNTEEFYRDSKKMDGLRSECKECAAVDNKKWRAKHSEEKRLYGKEYYEKHREEILANGKEYNKRPENRLRYNNNRLQRRRTDPVYNTICKAGKLYKLALRDIRAKKVSHSTEVLTRGIPNFDEDYLVNHFENQAALMYPDLYFRFIDTCKANSGWHLDHIEPRSNGKTVDEVERLCHLSNLRFITAEDNLTKGKSWPSNLPYDIENAKLTL